MLICTNITHKINCKMLYINIDIILIHIEYISIIYI